MDVGARARFAGALQIAPDEVLEAEADAVLLWEPKHDLEMFVKAMFWRYCLPRPELKQSEQREYHQRASRLLDEGAVHRRRSIDDQSAKVDSWPG